MSSDRRPNPGNEWHGARSSITTSQGGVDKDEDADGDDFDRCLALMCFDK